MKVSFCKSIEVESEVTINVEDITSALQDSLIEVMRDIKNDRERIFAIRELLSASIQCFKGVTDAMIADLPVGLRGAITTALRNEVERFDPDPASLRKAVQSDRQ